MRASMRSRSASASRPTPTPSASRRSRARLDELRAAEEAFLRTRRDLAEHSDAITAREQLLAQRERELDEREDGWGGPEFRDLESRLRRLETQRLTGDQTQELQRRLQEARAGRDAEAPGLTSGALRLRPGQLVPVRRPRTLRPVEARVRLLRIAVASSALAP